MAASVGTHPLILIGTATRRYAPNVAEVLDWMRESMLKSMLDKPLAMQ
ncbi:MAG: hypothetical protein ACO4AI_15980 [Prochlorothrix sp.]|nr:hypothetical protein [Prochlorothrix sp.]